MNILQVIAQFEPKRGAVFMAALKLEGEARDVPEFRDGVFRVGALMGACGLQIHFS